MNKNSDVGGGVGCRLNPADMEFANGIDGRFVWDYREFHCGFDGEFERDFR